MTPATAEHFVYWLYDADGALLYVGCSANVQRRIGNHRNKPWGEQIARMSTEGPYTKDEGLRIESTAIHTQKPLHAMSVQQVGQIGARRAAETRTADHAAGRRCQLPRCRRCWATFGRGPGGREADVANTA